MEQTDLLQGLVPYNLKHLQVRTLQVESQKVSQRTFHNILLEPKRGKPKHFIFVLSGFGSNGTKAMNTKPFENNFPQILDQWIDKNGSLDSIFVMVDAWNFWGGSQFINSILGNYEDYIVQELLQNLESLYPEAKKGDHAVMGGSSGGYGALHLASKYPQHFPYVAAIAPDSYFEASLLPDIYAMLPFITASGGVPFFRQEMQEGRFFKIRNAHKLLNVLAMGLCYAGKNENTIVWPIDDNGLLQDKLWEKWKAHDPVTFLAQRTQNTSALKGGFLQVGQWDQFHLQYGSRQIRNTLNPLIDLEYKEFDGNHFDLQKAHPDIYAWLKRVF